MKIKFLALCRLILSAFYHICDRFKIEAEHLLLKTEVASLKCRIVHLEKARDEAFQLAAANISRLNIRPGDVVTFTTNTNYVGTQFGHGWGALHHVSELLNKVAGGPVGVIVTSGNFDNPINIRTLTPQQRAKLKELLSKLT